MRLRTYYLFGLFGRNIRIFKQSHTKFQTKHISYRPVEIIHCDSAFFQCFPEILTIGVSAQVHIETGLQCQHGCFLIILCDPGTYDPFDTCQIRIDKSLKSPLFTKYIVQQIFIRSTRDTVD